MNRNVRNASECSSAKKEENMKLNSANSKKKKKRVCNRCVSLKQNLNEKQSKIIYL